MKIEKAYLILVSLLFFSLPSFAQYGSGADGDINDNSGTTYTDVVRTHLTSDAASGQAVITVNDASAFTNGDLCLVMQMLGTGVGRYEEATVSSKTATTITFISNLIYAYSANGTTNLAQVLRIPQYNNVTLKTSGDVLTCNAWNGFTGGVCYFKVSGTLDTDADGTITVAGKGYRGGSGASLVIAGTFDRPGRGATGNAQPPAAAASKHGGNANEGCSVVTTGSGVGSAGGTGANGNGGQGGNYIPSPDFATALTYLPPGPGGDGINGANGSSGEGPGGGTASSAATNNSNSSNWGATFGYDLLMGGGGAQGKQGFSGGRPSAGGGAGFGIAQRDGFCAVTGSPDGVAGGNGGTGGGILVMSVSVNQGAGIISVAGGNGSDGATGQTGSTGGNGGITFGGASIGGGGGGRGGTGGGGSCPGHGGAAGSLRLGNLFGYTFVTGGGIKGAYGAGGSGGTGGAGGNGSSIGNDGADDGQGGPGGYGGWSADGCRGTAGDPSVSTNPGKQTGQAGGAGAVAGCNDDGYCTSFTGGSAVVVLPIKLLSFTGISKNHINILRWSTASEENNNYFTLERSADGITFSEVGKINGAGNSSTVRNYEFIDETPTQQNYYRLSQTDFNGMHEKLGIISVSLSPGHDDLLLSIQSNPGADNNLFLSLYSSQNQEVVLKVLDLQGRTVRQEKYSLNKNENRFFSIGLDGVSPGAYFLSATTINSSVTRKFLLQGGE